MQRMIAVFRRTVTGTSTPLQAYRSGWSNRRVRLLVQIGFAALCIWIGIEFHGFVRYIESAGIEPYAVRPPGVDGFLPISSLMSLYYFILTGIIHPFHPAGLFILSAIILLSLLFGKAFCSWFCPVGLLSESLGDIGRKLFGRLLNPPRWLDYPLRSLKYLLLAFFVYTIFWAMDAMALRAFLDSPYNLVSDIKMYWFFAEPSRTTVIVLGILIALSLVIRHFWCRYLCPYGALLGVTSLLSPHKIKRIESGCIDCGACARVCPARINVDKVRTVLSDECTSCLTCVQSCPVSNTLMYQNIVTKRTISARALAITICVIFMAVTGTAMALGRWHNSVPSTEYLNHREALHSYGHPTTTRELERMGTSGQSRVNPTQLQSAHNK